MVRLEFETDEDRTYFLVRLPIHPAAYNDMGLDQVIEIKAETGADAVAKSVAKGTAKTGVEVGADANADTSQKSTFTRAQEKIASSFSKVLTKLWPSFHSNKEIFPRT